MLVVLGNLPSLIFLTAGINRTCSNLLAALALLCALTQLLLSGYRWQIIPGYALTIGLVIATAWIVPSMETRRGCLVAGYWALALSAMLGIWRFPLPVIPQPTGPFAVGTEVRHLVDAGRHETLAKDYDGPRELMVQFWYPVDAPKAHDGDRLSASASEGIAQLRAQRNEREAPIPNAPLALDQPNYPVLIFSPSWHGQRDQNSFQVEELASHGFIVVGIDHPYSSAVTVFPDGRRALAAPSGFFDLSSELAFQRSISFIEKVLRVRVQDVKFVAAELRKYSSRGSGDRFSERLDLERLGVFGYSFGGAAAAQACWEDSRFKAGIDMGGSMYAEVAEAGIRQPFLFMDDQTPRPTPAELETRDIRKRLWAQVTERDYRLEGHSAEAHGSYELQIQGAQHVDFTDPPALPPLRYYYDRGPINPTRAMRIINAYTVAFFTKYLNDFPQPLLDGPSPVYPEMGFLHRSTRAHRHG
jgi:hypothetical protein